ncbi:MAG: hypothetical protein U5Q03_10105 [Bacteroidota bacterium]|nr:hypothetical protein [Bacteroidota bacterium]
MIEKMNSFNGFGLELGIDSKIGKSIMSYAVGLGFNKLYAKNYSMNFVEIPAILNLNVGKTVGVFFGGGAKLRYLLKEPNHNFDYHHYERLLLSYTLNLGLSYKLKQLTFKLYPEFEFFQSRFYYTMFSPAPAYKGEDDYYLSILSLKFKCLF